MGLFQRLTSGLARRDDFEESQEEDVEVRPVQQQPAPERPRTSDSQGQNPISKYAPRSAAGGLDQHGRVSPVQNTPDDDQLDIPAFLRRQAK